MLRERQQVAQHPPQPLTFPESRNKPAVSMPAGSNPPTLPLRSTTIRDTPLDLNRSTAACTSPTVLELKDLIRTI